MTPEAQRIAIAEACGWKHCIATQAAPITKGGFKLPNYFGKDCEAWWHDDLPGVYREPKDYLSDLNAIAEVESWLLEQDTDAFERYTKTLCEVVDLEGGYYICATAPQRLQAMLKTLNLWTK